ncbi:helix-turn-helix domain-containing protein [Pedobacter duraquae]|uniref:AraC family transcriptional regulator n=1 Tax=Pedobacter duraquae TaxID=425511 RepID=A0A4R6IJ09_9SPHI|nr:AraC family transcriptional regulator [Pedobacter duraquae]TDO21984.1 AraC family transcriptional regulator [Pedobacter duraquae]
MILSIKNMVCDRCIFAVKRHLEDLDYTVNQINLGKVDIVEDLKESELATLSLSLSILGFEVISNQRERLIEQIKNVIITQIHHSDLSKLKINYSELLSGHIQKEYAYLSRIFSETEHNTIEQYIIQQKIEKVKELLEYEELNLNEISWKMGYSSSAHLSAQFKKITGLSPIKFKRKSHTDRKSLDRI